MGVLQVVWLFVRGFPAGRAAGGPRYRRVALQRIPNVSRDIATRLNRAIGAAGLTSRHMSRSSTRWIMALPATPTGDHRQDRSRWTGSLRTISCGVFVGRHKTVIDKSLF